MFIFHYFVIRLKNCNFGVQPDGETGSAEEQPASNMAVSKLETVENGSRSVRGGFNFTRMAIPLRKPLPSIREKLFVNCDVRQGPVKCLVNFVNFLWTFLVKLVFLFWTMQNYSYFCIRKGSFPLKEILRTAQATILGAGVSPGRKGSQKSTLFYLSGNIFNPSNRPWLAYIFAFITSKAGLVLSGLIT